MANIGGASNENDSQIKRRRRLPLELQCEVFSALPFHYGRRLLLLCQPIATTCIALTRKQKERLKNGWDPTACHEYLTIIEPERLLVQHNEIYSECCSVFAERPVPKNGIFYFEVNIIRLHTRGAIGLATKRMPLYSLPGFYKGTYSYWTYRTYANFYHPNASRREWSEPSFGAGDIVGCGINLATRQIIYTKNGQRLDTTNLFVADSADDLFPCVMLSNTGGKIEANFGPNFKFNIAKVINRFYGVF